MGCWNRIVWVYENNLLPQTPDIGAVWVESIETTPMTFQVALDGIWREFADVCDAVDFVFHRCANCTKECKGVFCRTCYRDLSSCEKRRLREKIAGKIIGYERNR